MYRGSFTQPVWFCIWRPSFDNSLYIYNVLVFSRCTWTLPTVNIVSTSKRRKLVTSWLVLAVRPVVESDRPVTAAALTALVAAVAAAFDPPALRASDALTDNRRRRRRTVSCSKLPIRATLKVMFHFLNVTLPRKTSPRTHDKIADFPVIFSLACIWLITDKPTGIYGEGYYLPGNSRKPGIVGEKEDSWKILTTWAKLSWFDG